MVMEVVHEDMGEGNMQCTNHQYKNSSPGGICAFCLQEKLGKLVSSSSPLAIFPSSSSSSPSPSFRYENPKTESNESCSNNGYYTRRPSRLPFVKKDVITTSDSSIVFKRSKSIATPRRGMHFLDENYNWRGFWSFLYLSKHHTSKKSEKCLKDVNFTPTTHSTVCSSSLSKDPTSKKSEKCLKDVNFTPITSSTVCSSSISKNPTSKQSEKCLKDVNFAPATPSTLCSSSLSKNPTTKTSEKTLKDVNFTPTTPSTVCSSSLSKDPISKRSEKCLKDVNFTPTTPSTVCSSSSSKNPTSNKSEKCLKDVNFAPTTPSTVCSSSLSKDPISKRSEKCLKDVNFTPTTPNTVCSSSLSKNPTSKRSEKCLKDVNFTPATPSTVCSSSLNGVVRSKENKKEDCVVVEENGCPNEVAKVSRSRSVGCGSRSFSGDFFERISTGFGDCTLRRVESQREGKSKVQSSLHRNCRCGGIFSGFMITSSSSSSSSSNSYSVSSSTDDNNNNRNDDNGNLKSISANSSARHLCHGRSKSWGWALASPIRAFNKPSYVKRNNNSNSNKNATPNLAAIPSLLSVSG